MIVQCRGCGRVLLKDGTWVDGKGEPDFLGACPTCFVLEKERDRLMRELQLQKTRALLRAGFGPAPEGVDVFKGFREAETNEEQ